MGMSIASLQVVTTILPQLMEKAVALGRTDKAAQVSVERPEGLFVVTIEHFPRGG